MHAVCILKYIIMYMNRKESNGHDDVYIVCSYIFIGTYMGTRQIIVLLLSSSSLPRKNDGD